jgi:hypothetical protein
LSLLGCCETHTGSVPASVQLCAGLSLCLCCNHHHHSTQVGCYCCGQQPINRCYSCTEYKCTTRNSGAAEAKLATQTVPTPPTRVRAVHWASAQCRSLTTKKWLHCQTQRHAVSLLQCASTNTTAPSRASHSGPCNGSLVALSRV